MAANTSGYTSKEIMSMQQDAIRRVNEMQRIAREKIANSENRSQNVQKPNERALTQPKMQNKPQNNNQNSEKQNHEPTKELMKQEDNAVEVVQQGLTGFLDRMNLDSETLLLLGLLLILVNEGADIMLIMALVYILL